MGVPNTQIPFLIIGDVTLQPLQWTPSNSFTASATKKITLVRSQSGKLYSQKSYEKYSVKISGVAYNLFPELRRQYERDDFIDLYSIANREEIFSGTGLTKGFFTTRRVRTDDALLYPIVHVAGVTASGITVSVAAGGTMGLITFTGSTPASGTNNIDVTYFPIINGQISEMESDWDWVKGSETWRLGFEEA